MIFKYLAPRPAFSGELYPLVLKRADDCRFEVTRPVALTVVTGGIRSRVQINAGFRTDFASIPWWGRWAIPKRHPDYDYAAVGHDWLYSHHEACAMLANTHGVKNARKFADLLMLEMSNRKSWRPVVIYWALRIGGKPLWNKYR